jgi:hypothetical protein
MLNNIRLMLFHCFSTLKRRKKANFVHVRDAVASFHTQEKQQC